MFSSDLPPHQKCPNDSPVCVSGTPGADRRQGGALSLADTMPLSPLMNPLCKGEPSVWDYPARTNNVCVCLSVYVCVCVSHNAGVLQNNL